MCKRKKSGNELTRASDERNRQWRSKRDKASFQRQNIILWEVNWNFGWVGSCKKTHQRWVNQIFAQNSKILPPFPSALNYDAKVWQYLKPGDLFWNVAGNLTSSLDKKTINSYRNW
jgi:hypothetical protein